METRTWKVKFLGSIPQNDSCSYDWSEGRNVRKLEVAPCDGGATIRITRNTAEECEEELWGQLSDGFFENYPEVANVEEII